MLLALLPLLASAQPEKAPLDEPRRVERLAGLCRLWGGVKFLHPFLAYRDVDWDQALLQAIPRVSAARDAAEYAAALSGMLSVLDDPSTEIVRQADNAAAPDQRLVEIAWPRPGTLYARFNKQATWSAPQELAAAEVLGAEIDKAQAVILDLRAAGPSDLLFQQIGSRLLAQPLRVPSRRYVRHVGLPPQDGAASGGFETSFATPATPLLLPRPDAPPRRVALVISRHSPMPPIAQALISAREANVLADGPVDDRSTIRRETLRLPDGLTAFVRLEELLTRRGTGGRRAMAQLAAGEDVVEAALRLLDQEPGDSRVSPGTLPAPDYVLRPERKYPEMASPSLEYRLLALFRLWNAVDRFYPYKHLIGDWAPVLGEFIPKFEAARDAREYALSVAELVARVGDSRGRVFGSAALTEFFGAAAPPFAVRVIDGQVVVTEVDEAAPVAVALGDVVQFVEDEPIGARTKRFERYVSASTREWRLQRVAQLALRGPAGASLSVVVQGKDGPARRVFVPRAGPPRPQPAAEPWQRSVPDELGYVDLRALQLEQVDAMFEALKQTKGLLLDMRGYPRSLEVGLAVAARLNTRGARHGATLLVPLVAPGAEGQRLYSQQPLPRTEKWKYAGRSVMLIDDRAISDAERSGLFFEAAADTRFVGSRSAGADGELTRVVLPGGLTVFLSGEEVRHADGRPLQRIGLQPQLEVKPTLQGIRDRRDEVLERAVRYLRDGS